MQCEETLITRSFCRHRIILENLFLGLVRVSFFERTSIEPPGCLHPPPAFQISILIMQF